VRVPMGVEQQRLYDWCANSSNVPAKHARIRAAKQITWLRNACADPKGFSRELRGGGVIGTDAQLGVPPVQSNFNPKTQAALDLIYQCLKRGEQVTVVCARVGQTDDLYFRLLSAIGEGRVARIDSTVQASAHATQAQRFKSGEARVLFMGMRCAKAYSFPRCPNMIILSLEYSWGSLDQARGRVWRVNSTGSHWGKAENGKQKVEIQTQPAGGPAGSQLSDFNSPLSPPSGRQVRVWCILHQGSIEETIFDVVALKQDAATICLLGRRVPREYKPVDMEEVLAESLLRTQLRQAQEHARLVALIESGGAAKEQPPVPTEAQCEKSWAPLCTAITQTQLVPAWLRRRQAVKT
jgi:hypothetical protein